MWNFRRSATFLPVLGDVMQMRALVPLFVLGTVLLTAAESEARHCRARGRLFRRSCCPTVCQPKPACPPRYYWPTKPVREPGCQCPQEEYGRDEGEGVSYWAV